MAMLHTAMATALLRMSHRFKPVASPTIRHATSVLYFAAA